MIKTRHYFLVAALASVLGNFAYADVTKVNWKKIVLDKASGVPDAKKHRYGLSGIIRVSVGPSGGFKAGYSAWAKISGEYKKGSKQAKEAIIFSGDVKGSLIVRFNCLKDPWLHKTSCVLQSASFAPKGKSKVNVNWTKIYQRLKRPLSIGAVTMAKAKKLSKNSAPPPPPPPPAKKKKTVTAKKAGPMVLKGYPDLAIASISIKVLKNCKKNARIVKVTVGIRNKSRVAFKNRGNKFLAKVVDLAPTFKLKSVYLPGKSIAPRATVYVSSTLAYYGQPYKQAGKAHALSVLVNPYHVGGEKNKSNNKKVFQFQFPKNFCMQMKRLPIKK